MSIFWLMTWEHLETIFKCRSVWLCILLVKVHDGWWRNCKEIGIFWSFNDSHCYFVAYGISTNIGCYMVSSFLGLFPTSCFVIFRYNNVRIEWRKLKKARIIHVKNKLSWVIALILSEFLNISCNKDCVDTAYLSRQWQRAQSIPFDKVVHPTLRCHKRFVIFVFVSLTWFFSRKQGSLCDYCTRHRKIQSSFLWQKFKDLGANFLKLRLTDGLHLEGEFCWDDTVDNHFSTFSDVQYQSATDAKLGHDMSDWINSSQLERRINSLCKGRVSLFMLRYMAVRHFYTGRTAMTGCGGRLTGKWNQRWTWEYEGTERVRTVQNFEILNPAKSIGAIRSLKYDVRVFIAKLHVFQEWTFEGHKEGATINWILYQLLEGCTNLGHDLLICALLGDISCRLKESWLLTVRYWEVYPIWLSCFMIKLCFSGCWVFVALFCCKKLLNNEAIAMAVQPVDPLNPIIKLYAWVSSFLSNLSLSFRQVRDMTDGVRYSLTVLYMKVWCETLEVFTLTDSELKVEKRAWGVR